MWWWLFSLLRQSESFALSRRPRRGPTLAAAATTVVASDASIVRPKLDPRSYRLVRFENGLEALLVADPDADEAGAAMSIKAGSFDDFDDRLGLAHFHEHMLFLGTEKYPKESEFDDFLASAGGGSNAYTADEETNFFFSCNAANLAEGLDRFAQFFLKPSMTRDAVDREAEAVNSEYEMSLNDDSWRTLAVHKAMVSKAHPFSRFSCGNKDTLGSGDDLWRALRRWNQEYYVAPKMRLCVVGGKDLDDLEAMVAAEFAKIPTATTTKTTTTEKAPRRPMPWEGLASSSTEIVPVRNLREVSILWPSAASKAGVDRLPDLIAAHVLGHEGAASLHALLRERGLIEGLTCCTALRFEDAMLFSMSLDLTEEGSSKRDEIIEACFQWIGTAARSEDKVKKITDEWLAIQRLRFDFAEREAGAESFASAVAESMWDYPTQPIAGPSLFAEVARHDRGDVHRKVLERLKTLRDPKSCFFVHVAPREKHEEEGESSEESSSEMPEFQMEKWHGARYRTRRLPEETLEQYGRLVDEDHQSLRLPSSNPFVATDLDLVERKGEGLFRLTDRLWRRVDLSDAPDVVRPAPKATGRVRVKAPAPLDARAIADARLFLKLVRAELNPEKYDGEMCGQYFDFRADSTGLRLGASGFSEKVTLCFDVLVYALHTAASRLSGDGPLSVKRPPPPITFASDLFSSSKKSEEVHDDDDKKDEEDEDFFASFERKFELEKAELARRCDDRSRDDPHAVAASFAARLADSDALGFDDLAAAARDTDLRSAARTVMDLLQTGRVEGYTAGNLDDSQAAKFVEALEAYRVDSSSNKDTEEERVRLTVAVPRGADVAVELRALRPSEAPRPTFLGETPPKLFRRKEEERKKLVLLEEEKDIIDDDDEEDSDEDEESEPNSAVKLVWQLWQMGNDDEARAAGWADSMERDAAFVLMQHLASPSAFNQLRTVEQLGYYVHTEVDMYNGVHQFAVNAQSAKVGPVELEERVLAWLAKFRDQLADPTSVTDEDLDSNKLGLADAIFKRPTCLADVVERDVAEVFSGRRFFTRRKRRATQIKHHTTREHLLKVIDDALLSESNRRLFKVRVYAPDLADQQLDDDKKNDDDAQQVVNEKNTDGGPVRLRSFDDIKRFQAAHPRHPPPIRWNEAASPDDPVP